MATTLENLHVLLARVQRNREGQPQARKHVVMAHNLAPASVERIASQTPSLPLELNRKSQRSAPAEQPSSEIWPVFKEREAQEVFAPAKEHHVAPKLTFAHLLERTLLLRVR